MISHVNFLTRSISDLHHKKDSAHLLYDMVCVLVLCRKKAKLSAEVFVLVFQ